MDQGGTVESDALVEPTLNDSVRREPGRAGERVAAAAQGSIAGHNGGIFPENENTPLLGKRGKSPTATEDELPNGGGDPYGHEIWRDFAGLPWWKTPSIFWIMPGFFLIAISFGGVMVPRINLILELVCREYVSEMVSKNPGFTMAPVIHGGDNPQCRIPEVQSRVARFNLYCAVIPGVLSAFVSPKLGAMSDRYGRNRIVALTGVGLLGVEALFIIAAKNPDTFPLYTILAAYAVDGLCGSFTTAMAIIHAYATDCTSPNKRSVTFAYFHSCLFVGVALGPISAGYLIKATGGPLILFIVALCSHLVFLAFLLLVIPESLSKARQLAAREKYQRELDELGPAADWINRIRAINFFVPLKILWPTGPEASAAVRRNLVLLSAIDTVVFGVAMGTMQVIVIYLNYQFGWRDFESSRFLSIVNISRVFCLVVALPTISRLVRGKAPHIAPGDSDVKHRGADRFDVAVIRVAILFDTVGYLGYSLSHTGALFTLSGVVSAVGGVASPMIQSALTKHVGFEHTGQILGAQGLLHALARVGGPLVFNAIYAKTVGKFTQTVFVCLTATFGAAAIASWFVRPNVYLGDPAEAEDEAQSHERPTSPLVAESR